jgi:hypothetical protein
MKRRSRFNSEAALPLRGTRGFRGWAFADLLEILSDFRAVNLRGRKSFGFPRGRRVKRRPRLDAEDAEHLRGTRGLRGWAFADLPEILTDFRAVNLRGRKSRRDFREAAA